jgi:hypothetical protein
VLPLLPRRRPRGSRAATGWTRWAGSLARTRHRERGTPSIARLHLAGRLSFSFFLSSTSTPSTTTTTARISRPLCCLRPSCRLVCSAGISAITQCPHLAKRHAPHSTRLDRPVLQLSLRANCDSSPVPCHPVAQDAIDAAPPPRLSRTFSRALSTSFYRWTIGQRTGCAEADLSPPPSDLDAVHPPLQSRNRPIADFWEHKFDTPSLLNICDSSLFRLHRHDDTAVEGLGDGLPTRLKGVAPALEPSCATRGSQFSIPQSWLRPYFFFYSGNIITADCCWGKEHVKSGPRGARSSHGLCCMQCCVCGSHSSRGQIGEERRCDVSGFNRNRPKSCGRIRASSARSQSRRRQPANTAWYIQRRYVALLLFEH